MNKTLQRLREIWFEMGQELDKQEEQDLEQDSTIEELENEELTKIVNETLLKDDPIKFAKIDGVKITRLPDPSLEAELEVEALLLDKTIDSEDNEPDPEADTREIFTTTKGENYRINPDNGVWEFL